MRVAVEIELSEADRERLERWSRSRSVAVRLRERSRMVLMAADGMTNKAIAAELGTDRNKVGRWRRRFAGEGLDGIAKERPRGGNHGGKCSKAQARLRSEVVRLTTQTDPPDATHWSCRSLARAAGTTHSFVHRVWRSYGLKPHLVRTIRVSTDPRFEEKVQDVVGLYLNPPDKAAVFSFDEKSSIQALDRTQRRAVGKSFPLACSPAKPSQPPRLDAESRGGRLHLRSRPDRGGRPPRAARSGGAQLDIGVQRSGFRHFRRVRPGYQTLRYPWAC